jgi:hypothetical protein
MERMKKIILFIIGLLVIPTVIAFLTAFILKIDIFERLYISLFFDYMIAYILTPLLYRPRIQKHISNKYVFFALIFFVFWLLETFRITFI